MGAHPRSRGEHVEADLRCGVGEGSSPLARGTQQKTHPVRVGLGLIPARAGNTRFMSSSRTGCWAHPRSRGEHVKWAQKNQDVKGSSPLARGTPSKLVYSPNPLGLIPARAGNTGVTGAATAGVGAHPRSRGEHPALPAGDSSDTGSSPLARGTPKIVHYPTEREGLIPARAGNTVG